MERVAVGCLEAIALNPLPPLVEQVINAGSDCEAGKGSADRADAGQDTAERAAAPSGFGL